MPESLVGPFVKDLSSKDQKVRDGAAIEVLRVAFRSDEILQSTGTAIELLEFLPNQWYVEQMVEQAAKED